MDDPDQIVAPAACAVMNCQGDCPKCQARARAMAAASERRPGNSRLVWNKEQQKIEVQQSGASPMADKDVVKRGFETPLEYANTAIAQLCAENAALRQRAEAAEAKVSLLEDANRKIGNQLHQHVDALRAAEAELAGVKDDYLRRHNDAVDELEKRIAAEARVAGLLTLIGTAVHAYQHRASVTDDALADAKAALSYAALSPDQPNAVLRLLDALRQNIRVDVGDNRITLDFKEQGPADTVSEALSALSGETK